MNEIEIIKGTDETKPWKIFYEISMFDFMESRVLSFGIMKNESYLWRNFITEESYGGPFPSLPNDIAKIAVGEIEKFLNSLCAQIDHIQVVERNGD
jgi:hypothetical protein